MIKYIKNLSDCNINDHIDKVIINSDIEHLLEIIDRLKYYKGSLVIYIDISKNNYDILKKIKDNYNLNIEINYTTYINQKEPDKIDICTLDEYLNLELILNRYTEFINSKDYSPLEKCVYAYDLVKLHMYKYTLDYLDKDIQIHNTINDINYVCGSYAKIFNAILAKLNINSIVYKTYYIMGNKISIHYKNICYLKDKKYNVDGIYYFDVTSDKIKDFDSSGEIDKYGHFLVRPEKLFHYKLQEVVSCATCVYVDKRLQYLISNKMRDDSIELFENLLNIKINNYEELLNICKAYNKKVYPKKILDAIMSVYLKEGFILNEDEYYKQLESVIGQFIKCEEKKMKKFNRYIFLDGNEIAYLDNNKKARDSILNDIHIDDEDFNFEFSQIYGKIDTLRK